jgi:hypothetical protein
VARPHPISSCTLKWPRVNAAMSFGFSVGYFLTVIQLANKIGKDFGGAPSFLSNKSSEKVDDVLEL